MVSKKSLVVACQVTAWVVLAFWVSNSTAASARYDTATPHAPPYRIHKYIPLHDAYNVDSEDGAVDVSVPEPATSSRMPPSEVILTALRTILDVVRNVNSNRAKARPGKVNSTVTLRRPHPRNVTRHRVASSGRGYHDDDHFDYDEHHDTTTTTAKPMKQGRYTDPWAGYYDWIINEGSFKFWSVFQLFTAALLLYACLSAIYYAKFNPIIPDYDREYDDYFLERTVGRKARSLDSWELPSGLSWINPQTFQFIMNAISQHYAEE